MQSKIFRIKNTIQNTLIAAIFILPFSYSASASEFIQASQLADDDRYIVVIGDKFTDARPSYIRQLKFADIDQNIISDVLKNSEGVYVDVAELASNDNTKLIDEIYQAYNLNSIMYFDTRDNQQLAEFRNTFLSENFLSNTSTERFKSVYNDTSLSSEQSVDLFLASHNSHPKRRVNQISTKAAAAEEDRTCKNLLIAGQVFSLLSAGGYTKNLISSSSQNFQTSIQADLASQAETSANSVSLAAGLVIFDLFTAIYNAGRIIGCSESAEKFLTRSDIEQMLNDASTKKSLSRVIEQMTELGDAMTRNTSDLYGEFASIATQKAWISDKLNKVDAIHIELRLLADSADYRDYGIGISNMTGMLVAIELGLLKTYYGLYEDDRIFNSNEEKKAKRKNAISYLIGNDKEIARLKTLTETLNRIKSAALRHSKAQTADVHYSHATGCLADGRCIVHYDLVWGECYGPKNNEGPRCYIEKRSKFSRVDENTQQSIILNYQFEVYFILMRYLDRYDSPRIFDASYDYAEFFKAEVEKLQRFSGLTYPKLRDLVADYNGYSLENTVGLHPHGNQEGYEIELETGSYAFNDLYDKGMDNDSITSLSIPDGLMVTIYANNDFSGWHKTFFTNASLAGQYNDSVSAIKVERNVVIAHENGRQNEDAPGFSVRLNTGVYPFDKLISTGVVNDEISSLTIPDGYEVTIYEHGDFSGWYRRYLTNVSLTGIYNDKVSAIKIERSKNVTVYQHGYQDLSGYAIELGEGSYNADDLIEKGIQNNDISSISVPLGYQVIVYENADFSGFSRAYVSNATLTGKFDNSVSAIKISRKSVLLHQHGNQNREFGYYARLSLGFYDIDDLSIRGIKNDDISSLTIPEGYEVSIYEHAYFTGWSKTYRSNTSLFGGYNDNVSALKIMPSRYVTVYQDGNQSGYAVELAVGAYDHEDLLVEGAWDNDLSSLSIPAGYKVTLYENSDLTTGWSKVYISDSQPVRNINLTGSLNDSVSAIVIEDLK